MKTVQIPMFPGIPYPEDRKVKRMREKGQDDLFAADYSWMEWREIDKGKGGQITRKELDELDNKTITGIDD